MYVTGSKPVGPQQAGTEAIHYSYARRSGDTLALPGALSRCRVSNQRSPAVDQDPRHLPQAPHALLTPARRAGVDRRPSPTATPHTAHLAESNLVILCDDRGRAPRALASLHTRTATLGVALGCVCEHVREAPLASPGRRGDRRRVVLLQPAVARRLVSAHHQRHHHHYSCGCCRRQRHTHPPPPAADHHHTPRHRHAASHHSSGHRRGAERADRALCSLVAQVPSTRRGFRCKVSRFRRICPADSYNILLAS